MIYRAVDIRCGICQVVLRISDVTINSKRKIAQDRDDISPCDCRSQVPANACGNVGQAMSGCASTGTRGARPAETQGCAAGSQPLNAVNASWDGEATFTIRNSAGAELVMGKGVNPVEGLMSSLGACVGLTTVALLSDRNSRPMAVDVRVKGEKRTTPPVSLESLHVIITLKGDLKEEPVTECIQQAMTMYCPVATTLIKAVDLTWEHRIVR